MPGGAPASEGEPTRPAEPKFWQDDEADEFDNLRKSVPRSYIFEERLAAAARCKDEGNALLNDGEYADAHARYEEGLYHVDFDEFQRMELMEEHTAALFAVRLPLLLNSVLCALRMHPAGSGDTRLTIAETRCDEVLKREPGNTKAQFRRAQLHVRAGDDAAAKALLEALCKAQPAKRAFRAELQALTEAMRASRKTQDAFWSDAVKKHANKVALEPDERAVDDPRASADGEPCLSRGAGPLTGRGARTRDAARSDESSLASSSGPLGPMLSALRGLGDISSMLWGLWAQIIWPSAPHAAGAAAAAAFGSDDSQRRRKRDE
jgi:hypothetical protein